VNNDRYSYVNAAVAQGYSTLAIDRIGVGESSTPAAVDVTLDSNVQTVHDVVRALRDGSVTGSPVHRVVLVGHSFGSAISVTEAGRFHDVDAVVKDTDPRVLAFDEAHKGTGTEGEIATFGAYLSPVYDALTVTIPVLFAMGSADAYFCTLSLPCTNGRVVAAREQPYFTDTAKLSGYVLPGAGHNMALELNSPLATTAILNWIDHPTHGVPGVGLDLPVTRALLSPLPHI
jgi:pimeloyl-ACP methyl ester carboxylesterase